QIDERASRIPTPRRHLVRSRLWLAVGIFGLIGLLAACSEEGQSRLQEGLENVDTSAGSDGDSSQEAAPEETSPPETEAPAPTEAPPAEGGASEPAADEDGLSTEDWILLLAIGAVALIVIFGAIGAVNRRSASKAATRSELSARLSEIVGQSRWLHDSGSVEVLLATDPDQMQMAWRDVRTRMVDLESRIATMAAGTGDPNLDQDLRYLGQCVADLRSAEEGYVNTRLRAGQDQAALTRTSDQTVTDRRQQLQYAIEPVASALRA
ncbi:MAG: hypothetical protein OEV40_14335, partial [Acidimicrobiia bacterium]|nr:hypothetical protein [Acidimicrobiia bacterium]